MDAVNIRFSCRSPDGSENNLAGWWHSNVPSFGFSYRQEDMGNHI